VWGKGGGEIHCHKERKGAVYFMLMKSYHVQKRNFDFTWGRKIAFKRRKKGITLLWREKGHTFLSDDRRAEIGKCQINTTLKRGRVTKNISAKIPLLRTFKMLKKEAWES